MAGFELPKFEGLLQRLLRNAEEGHTLSLVAMGLALAGTVTAAYPVTAVIVPAALLAPRRWRRLTLLTALGSALGATLLVEFFHHLGWNQIYARFPELASRREWAEVMDWVVAYGALALFLISASPLPQTPALIVFAIGRHDYFAVFVAMFCGKLIKYGLFAWAASRFPERFSNGIAGFLRWRSDGKGRS